MIRVDMPPAADLTLELAWDAPPVERQERTRRTEPVSLDIVIPMHNEAAVLPALLGALGEVFKPDDMQRHAISKVSCLLVDDGSRDGSVDVARRHQVPGVEIAVIRLSRNFGHQAAVTAGIDHSSADLVAVMDADLQDPPACVLDMVEKWRQGFEVVYAVRRNRKEGMLKISLYWAFYRLYHLLSPIVTPIDSGDFCLMSRRVVDELNRLPEKVRFPRGLRTWVGFPQAAIEYDRPARFAGETHYGFRDLYRLATDGITSLSLRPLQLAQLLSFLYLLLSLGGLAAIFSGAFDAANPGAQLSVVLVLMLLSNSIILFCLYILGAYLGRTYLEVKARPSYIVAEVLRRSADDVQ